MILIYIRKFIYKIAFFLIFFVSRQMAKIEELQNVLDDMGAMRKIVVHLNSGVNETIIQEALALMVKMLFAGNVKVQVCRHEKFYKSYE